MSRVSQAGIRNTEAGIVTFFFPSSSSFDNSHLCSGGGDKTVVLWDVATGQVVRKFRGHAGKVNTVQFNEEATVILSVSDVGTADPGSLSQCRH